MMNVSKQKLVFKYIATAKEIIKAILQRSVEIVYLGLKKYFLKTEL